MIYSPLGEYDCSHQKKVGKRAIPHSAEQFMIIKCKTESGDVAGGLALETSTIQVDFEQKHKKSHQF